MLTKDQKVYIANELLGSCDNTLYFEDLYGVEYFEVSLAAEEEGVWNCEECGWWVEEGELASEADGEVLCADCFIQREEYG